MRLRNINDVNDFLRIVDECVDAVYLVGVYGDKLSIKSSMSRYVAVCELLSEHGDELMLCCDNKEDEARFVDFFYSRGDIL